MDTGASAMLFFFFLAALTPFSSMHTQSVAPAPTAASVPTHPGFKVALLGAAGGIGQPLGMLLKM